MSQSVLRIRHHSVREYRRDVFGGESVVIFFFSFFFSFLCHYVRFFFRRHARGCRNHSGRTYAHNTHDTRRQTKTRRKKRTGRNRINGRRYNIIRVNNDLTFIQMYALHFAQVVWNIPNIHFDSEIFHFHFPGARECIFGGYLLLQ